jgi:hypothetical protein
MGSKAPQKNIQQARGLGLWRKPNDCSSNLNWWIFLFI